MKQLLKELLKKLFEFFYGTQEDIKFKFSLAVLTTGVALLILSFLYRDDPAIFTTLSYLSTLSFIVWILTTKGFNAMPHYAFELLRLILYPVAFTWAVNTFINNSKYTGFWLCFYVVLASVCFLLCFIYFIVKLFDILAFFKKVFAFIRSKLYGSEDVPLSRTKTFIENIAALLASIISISVAVQTLSNTFINVFRLLK